MPRIVVSLSQRRLYLFEGNRLIRSFPVGLGRITSQAPAGRYTIINKVPYPYSWPGGPLSAYGTLWMGLSRPRYGIHGTDRPDSIAFSSGQSQPSPDALLPLTSPPPGGVSALPSAAGATGCRRPPRPRNGM